MGTAQLNYFAKDCWQ